MGLGAHATTRMNIRQREASTRSSPSNKHPNLQCKYMLVGGSAAQGDDPVAAAPYCVQRARPCGGRLGGHSAVVCISPHVMQRRFRMRRQRHPLCPGWFRHTPARALRLITLGTQSCRARTSLSTTSALALGLLPNLRGVGRLGEDQPSHPSIRP